MDKTDTSKDTETKADLVKDRCPDYDETCSKVPSPFDCWKGGTFISPCCGKTFELDPVKGYCPLLHN